MFRLILLAVREIERRNSGALPLSYFAFWTVRLAGWLPRFNACATCGKPFGKQPAYQAASHPGLLCEEHRRSGMKPVSFAAGNSRNALRENAWTGSMRQSKRYPR